MARGSSSRSGPAPDPNALRRDRPTDKADWVLLPKAGRSGKAPAWPLSAPTSRERQLWTAEWKRPQAIMWERNGQEAEVALYVRVLVDAESPRATSATRTLVVRMMETLAISVPGLQRARWRIVDEIEDKPQRSTSRRSSSSARDRLRVVEGGASS